MKSYVSYLQGILRETLVDLTVVFPRLRKDFERDMSRLQSLVEARGLPFLMVDLPLVGKALDCALSTRQLTRLTAPGFRRVSPRVQVPRLFKGLWRLVFDDSGRLLDDPDIQAVRALRQVLYFAKKFDTPCPESSNWKAVNDFFRIDQELRSPSLDWDGDRYDASDLQHLDFRDASPSVIRRRRESENLLFPDNEPSFPGDDSFYETLNRVTSIIAADLGVFRPEEWSCRHGPGAVADQRHTQFKYDFPNWPAKLDGVFPMDAFAFANASQWVDHISGEECSTTILSDHEPPSRLIVVPKTLKGPRLIAAEPVSHQWAQQSILDFLSSRIQHSYLRNCVDISSQDPNGQLALEASRTESHLTMDLSSASDRLSCWAIERAFRRNKSLLDALHASRTRWVSNSIDKLSPRFSRIKKFACMGSACTFPIQSIFFSMVAIAACLYSKGIRPSSASIRSTSRVVRVFGDDIIIPTYAREAMQEYMSYLQLEVNHSKTYWTGKFRESCGVDAYDGHDVTPVYVRKYPERSRPESVVSAVESHNNFFIKGYYAVSGFIERTVPCDRVKPIPKVRPYSGQLGFYSFDPEIPPITRWNKVLQRVECLVQTASAVCSRTLPAGNSLLLQFFTVARLSPKFLLGDRLGIVGRPRMRMRPRWVELALINT